MVSPLFFVGSRFYRFCPLLSDGGTPDGKVRFFLPQGAARFLSGITGAVSFWTGLAGWGAAGVMVGLVFVFPLVCLGETGGSIWRSVLTGGVCSWWMEAAFYHRNRSPFRHSSP